MALFVLASKDGWVNIMYTGLDAVGVDQQVGTYVLLVYIVYIFTFGEFAQPDYGNCVHLAWLDKIIRYIFSSCHQKHFSAGEVLTRKKLSNNGITPAYIIYAPGLKPQTHMKSLLC